jgi:UDP-glucose 4-epimerase
MALARSHACAEAFLIAVTGASGYIGAHCVARGLKANETVVAISTQAATTATTRASDRLRWQYLDDYATMSVADWQLRFTGIRSVIHCAARVHRARVRFGRAVENDAMQRDNVELTARMARGASLAGVERFVFLSSAAVYGDAGSSVPFDENSVLNPQSAYARSKVAAEEALSEIAIEGTMQVAILRPPAVYGADSPGNMARLARAIARGIPMPFVAVKNRRSMVSINTVSACALWCALRHDAAAKSSQVAVWLPVDREPISSAQIVAALARGMGVRPRSWAAPPRILKAALIMVGARRVASQLLDDWQLDGSGLIRAGFTEQMDTEIGLELMGRSYNAAKR